MKHLKAYEAWIDNKYDPVAINTANLKANRVKNAGEDAWRFSDDYEKYKDKILKETVGETDTFVIAQHKYDVTKAWKMIQEDPEKYKGPGGEMYVMDPASLRSMMSMIQINKEYAKGLSDEELDQPGIVIVDQFGPEGEEDSLLIDGWHRAYGNAIKGNKEMPIWVMTDLEDIKKIKIR